MYLFNYVPYIMFLDPNSAFKQMPKTLDGMVFMRRTFMVIGLGYWFYGNGVCFSLCKNVLKLFLKCTFIFFYSLQASRLD